MLSSIHIAAFKSFASEHITFGRLNIFTGLNNSGKSTILQALRICVSACSNSSPYLEGLGNWPELRSKFSPPQSAIVLTLVQADNSTATVSLDAHGFSVHRDKTLPFLEYIAADRFGPRVALPIMGDGNAKLSVGCFGQYSAHFARIFENASVNPLLRHPDSAGNTLRHQLVRWMGEISPGVKLDFDVAARYDSSSISVDGHRSTNSGFGLSYTLPIVLALLAMTADVGTQDSDEAAVWIRYIQQFGGALVIENPEAHLHPRGQTNIGRLIVLAAAAGLQIFLETHSDHLVDGIRLGVRELDGKMPASDVKVKFLSRSVDGESETQDVILKQNGKFERWPSGFFDQFSINLRALSSKNA